MKVNNKSQTKWSVIEHENEVKSGLHFNNRDSRTKIVWATSDPTSMCKADFEFGKSLKDASEYHWADSHSGLCRHAFEMERQHNITPSF